MKLNELQDIANAGYNGGKAAADYYDKETGKPTEFHPGDGLEWFMAVEIAETFDETASDEDQVGEAVRVLENAISNLGDAVDSLTNESRNYGGRG